MSLSYQWIIGIADIVFVTEHPDNSAWYQITWRLAGIDNKATLLLKKYKISQKCSLFV